MTDNELKRRCKEVIPKILELTWDFSYDDLQFLFNTIMDEKEEEK